MNFNVLKFSNKKINSNVNNATRPRILLCDLLLLFSHLKITNSIFLRHQNITKELISKLQN